MERFLSRPKDCFSVDLLGRYESLGLKENPFPLNPIVNKDSTDQRINGSIYEPEIRLSEFEKIKKGFLAGHLSNPNHQRLGYIIDTSYVGRGNGKSAFLVNLNKGINKDFANEISEGRNRCFSVHFSPEPGGRIKTFSRFSDSLFEAFISQGVIDLALTTLRLDAISNEYSPQFLDDFHDEGPLLQAISKDDWYKERNFDLIKIEERIRRHPLLQQLPTDFPAFSESGFFPRLSTSADFVSYFRGLKGERDRFDFIFSHLVSFFLASNFNGAFIFVDDFERIPDFQSARQKRDFALELRSCLFDGCYVSAKTGFYNFLLVLHAGVSRLISESWSESGLEARAPISSDDRQSHVVPFEKLSHRHARLLLVKYLDEYRINLDSKGSVSPFSDDCIELISQKAELNATRILKLAYQLIENSVDTGQSRITKSLVEEYFAKESPFEEEEKNLSDIDAVDLLSKAKGGK